MNRGAVATQWAVLRSQWSLNARLRMGVWSIIALVWIYALLVVADSSERQRKNSAALREQIARLQPLAKERAWGQRADDARQQRQALQSMLWAEADIGLAEAALQDWLRSTAAKAGLNLRELTLARPASVAAVSPAAAAVSAQGDATQAVKARMVVDLNRLPLLAFLAEVGRSERVVVVDRLLLRTASQPASAEIDLRVLVATKGSSK